MVDSPMKLILATYILTAFLTLTTYSSLVASDALIATEDTAVHKIRVVQKVGTSGIEWCRRIPDWPGCSTDSDEKN